MHGLLSIALAMALSTLIEKFGPFDRFEDAVVQEVARQRELSETIKPPAPHELQIHQLEVSARVRVETLEQRAGVEGVVQRLGGVAPIQRGALAEVITALASRLPEAKGEPDPASTPIVAIDIDLAPLEGGATSTKEQDTMLNAINALRAKAHVIAVVLPRAAGANGGRKERNEFMQKAKCTRVIGAAATAPNQDPRTRPNALFFASPRLFHDAGSYPTRYPYQLDDKDKSDLPPHYPSLGTLTLLQFEHQFMHHASQGSDVDEKEHARLSSARQTLTIMCEQAYAAHPESELLEDRMATPAAQDIAKAYKEQRYSWRLLDDPRLQQTVTDKPDLSDWAWNLPPGMMQRPVLLLGIDGGASYDKFGIAGISPEPVSGASLHALQALSIKAQHYPIVEKSAGILVDGLLGILYWMTWEKLLQARLKRVRKSMPVLGSWLSVGVPLVVGGLLVWLCFKLVVIGMGVDLWINPIYIIVSLLLSIYVDAWSDSESGTQAQRKRRTHLLGLPAARDALRGGFGDRAGANALTDTVLSAALRLVVLIAGWGFIFREFWKGGMS